MVNYQTSQNELLNLFFHWSCLGVFQCVRDILQVTVSLDHPVVMVSVVIVTVLIGTVVIVTVLIVRVVIVTVVIVRGAMVVIVTS